MDINLHSFILVMGLLVIGFIVFDGIKKIRENKKNQLSVFDNDLDALNTEETQFHDELAEQGYDELEIADDLVDGAFVNDLADGLKEGSVDGLVEGLVEAESESAVTEEVLESFSATDSSDEVDQQLHSEPTQDYLENDALTQYVDDIEAPVADVVAEAKDISCEKNTTKKSIAKKSTDLATESQPSDNPHFTFSLKEETELETAILEPEIIAEPSLAESPKVKPAKQRLSSTEAQAKKAALESELQAKSQSSQGKAEPVDAPEPLELDPEETVPVLMEPVELGEEVDPNPPVQQELHLPEFVQQTLLEEPIFAKKDTVAEEQLQDYINMNLDDVAVADAPTLEQVKAEPLQVGERLSEREVAQEVFVIHVLNQDGLCGLDLRRVFTACDMRFGEMNIFHRFEKANAQGKIQFSVANSLEPGSFDIENMDTLSTPGISLFMSLPGPDNAMEAFDAMAEVALVFARNFNANLCDDSHSDLTPQTLEHYRQRIRDFSRKHLSTLKK